MLQMEQRRSTFLLLHRAARRGGRLAPAGLDGEERAVAEGMEQPQFLGVHHVLLAVPPDQKEAAKRYYEQVLGFVPVASPLESGGSGNL